MGIQTITSRKSLFTKYVATKDVTTYKQLLAPNSVLVIICVYFNVCIHLRKKMCALLSKCFNSSVEEFTFQLSAVISTVIHCNCIYV